MGNKVKVVIGDRLGKGQQVAKGVEAAGGEAILIPGVGADMKVGDVMHAEQADFGISFCGSGEPERLRPIRNISIRWNSACVPLMRALRPFGKARR